MKIISLGHSTFVLSLEGKKILMDPFFPTKSSQEIIKNITPDYVFLTHGHADHVSGLSEVPLADDTQIIAPFELAALLEKKGYKNVIPCNPGLRFNEIVNTEIRCVPAVHSSTYEDVVAGVPVGFIIKYNDRVLYISGDTSLTIEMQLLPEYYGHIDWAVLPVGGQFTMDWKDLPLACKMLQCRQVIGCHFNTFEAISIDTQAAVEFCRKQNIALQLPSVGTEIDLG